MIYFEVSERQICDLAVNIECNCNIDHDLCRLCFAYITYYGDSRQDVECLTKTRRSDF